ncbi:MAG: hypothetical protein ACFFAO_02690 [Candidatus Hermodarchaeota archaeon]
MADVIIRCPSCGNKGKINVSDESIKEIKRGLLAINIASNIVCSHSFIAYIDGNFQVRDYFIADFHVEIPDIAPSKELKDISIPKKDVVDIDLIKLNLPATLITYIIKSILSNQKILLISDNKFLHNHILNFFKYITQDTFEINISMTNEEDYKKNKKLYKDYMVFHDTNIIRNHQNIIVPKKLGVEKEIVSKFVTESELGYSYIILKNEIQKIFELSKAIVDLIKEDEKDDKINILKILNKLEENYEIKISTYYSNFLLKVVKEYFDISVPTISESFLDILGNR